MVRRSLSRMFSPLTRAAVTAVAACAVLGLTACGGDGDAATVTTIAIRPESYVVKPPATPPTTAPAVPAPDEEGRSQAEQAHTINADEYPFEIAQLYDIPLDELRNWNGWEADYSNFPGAGGTARIPPGAKFIDPTATTAPDTGATDEQDDDATTAAPASCTGTHELEEGDYPVDVARKYDVTIDALLAANGFSMDAAGNVAQWPAVGTTVNIPLGADCAPATTVAAG